MLNKNAFLIQLMCELARKFWIQKELAIITSFCGHFTYREIL